MSDMLTEKLCTVNAITALYKLQKSRPELTLPSYPWKGMRTARLRHIAGTQWSTGKYMNMEPLRGMKPQPNGAALAQSKSGKILDTTWLSVLVVVQTQSITPIRVEGFELKRFVPI